MRQTKLLSLSLLSLMGICLVAPLSHAGDEQPLTSASDKTQYAIGVEVARNFKNQGLKLDPEMVMKGIRDGLSGGKLLLSEKELRNILISIQSDIRRKQSMAKRKDAGDNNQ